MKWTAEDAAELGFATRLLWSLSRPVDPEADEDVRASLAARGVEIDTETRPA